MSLVDPFVLAVGVFSFGILVVAIIFLIIGWTMGRKTYVPPEAGAPWYRKEEDPYTTSELDGDPWEKGLLAEDENGNLPTKQRPEVVASL